MFIIWETDSRYYIKALRVIILLHLTDAVEN